MAIYTLKSGMGGITIVGSTATTTGVDIEDLLLYTMFLSGGGVHSSTSLAVTENSPAGKSVLVAPGVCYVANSSWAEGSNLPKFWPVIVTSNATVTIADNASGNPRIDVIYAKYDTSVSADANASNVATITVVAGTPAASPSAPATPSDGLKLAEVAVANGFSSIVNANITDSRTVVGLLDASVAPYLNNDVAWSGKESGGTIRALIKMATNNLITIGNTTNNAGIFTKVLARAYLGATQSDLVSGTPTKVTLDTESYDPGSYFNTTTNRFVCPYDGYYLVTAQLALTSASVVADRAYNVDIYKNNASYKSNSIHAAAALGIRPSVTDIVEASANDYIEMFATSVAGVNTVDIVAGATFTNMTISLIALK